MKKQRELLEKLKNPEKKAPSREGETTVGGVVRKNDPTPSVLYKILVEMDLPFAVGYGDSQDDGWELSIGKSIIAPSPHQKGNCCIKERSGMFLRPLDAVLKAVSIEIGRLIQERL